MIRREEKNNSGLNRYITFDARRQHDALLSLELVLCVQKSDDRSYMWFYRCLRFAFFKYV